MDVILTLPEDLADKIIAGLEAKADAIAEERAKLIVDGNRWVNIKQAVEITGRNRASLRAAVTTKQVAYYMDRGQPQFKIKDLWVWMDQTRREANKIN